MQGTDEHFQVQLCRLYPHIYNVMRRLVQEYDNAFNNITQTKETGIFCISAVFGRLCHGDKAHFDSNLAISEINTIFTQLNSFDSWDSISDWFLQYEYRVGSNTNVRVSYENKRQVIRTITERKLSAIDCSYRQANAAQKVSDSLTRICMTWEQEAAAMSELASFGSVQVSMRKYFVIRSSNMQSVSFRFELIQYWEGETTEEAEKNMRTNIPLCSFRCEAVTNASVVLSTAEKSVLFVSLLLKMQDFIDIPVYTRLLHCNDRVSPYIPIFEIVA